MFSRLICYVNLSSVAVLLFNYISVFGKQHPVKGEDVMSCIYGGGRYIYIDSEHGERQFGIGAERDYTYVILKYRY